MNNDVAIIGAGPGGAWTAYRLCRAGARVLLFDPSHPREKPCGGGVTGRALSLIGDALDVDRLDAVRIRRATFRDAESTTLSSVPLAASTLGDGLIVASRTELDAKLLDAARGAGAELVPARVTGIVRTADGWRIDTGAHVTHHARFLVGADGANSLVRRRLTRGFSRAQLSIATGFFAHGVTSDEIVIELMAEPPGYLWSFPRPDHLAIGICAQADAGVTAGALRTMAARWMDRTGLASGARLAPYGWPIPSLSARDVRRLPVGGAGWCLVGDAAGLVDPITREGIFFALQSGQLAADALTSGAPSPDCVYSDWVASKITAELRCAARFKAAFFRADFIHLLLSGLRRSARVRGVMADLVAGNQSYRGLKWRLARTLELGLAARAMRAWRVS